MNNQFVKDLQDADMILVGLGEEFDFEQSLEEYSEKKGCRNMLNILAETEDCRWFLPYYKQYLIEEGALDTSLPALEKLAELIEGKNYFVVAQTFSRNAAKVRWREGRFVQASGGIDEKYCKCNRSFLEESEYEKLNQCCEKLSQLAMEIQKEDSGDLQSPGDSAMNPEVAFVMALLAQREKTKKYSEQVKKIIGKDLLGRCPKCGETMVLCTERNEIQNKNSESIEESIKEKKTEEQETGTEKADPSWMHYMKWLQGTVNRKLLLVELGVGMNQPQILRFPFERILYLNQKAKLYRVNRKLYHLTENAAEKGVGIAENAIDWLENLC